MINLNEMSIHCIVKTHLKVLRQSVSVDSLDDEFYKKAIEQIEQLSLNDHHNHSQYGDNKTNEEIIIAMSLLQGALELKSNLIKSQTLQIVESMMSGQAIHIQFKVLILPHAVEMAHYAVTLNNQSINEIILSIANAITVLDSKKEYSIGGLLFYDLFDICFEVYLNGLNDNNEDLKEKAAFALEEIIKMKVLKAKEPLTSINNNNNSSNEHSLLTKGKWLNKMQKGALNKYMEYYLDVIEFDHLKLATPKKNSTSIFNKTHLSVLKKQSINEKGIESGRYGFCINCRNQANFHSNDYSFPFCSMKCFNDMIILINEIDLAIAVEDSNANDDLINLIAILSHIIAIDSKYAWEYRETAISQMKYYAMTLIHHILCQILGNQSSNKEKVKRTIKDSLYPYALINSALSLDFKTFVLANQMLLLLLESSYKIYLVEEIEQYVEKVYLYYLQTESIPLNYKGVVIDSLSRVIDKSFAIELFINYDCNMFSSSLYYELLEIITKIIHGIYYKKNEFNSIDANNNNNNMMTMILSEKKSFGIQCLDLISKLIQHLDSIVKSESNEIQSKASSNIINRTKATTDIEIALDSIPSVLGKSGLNCNRIPQHRPSSEVITRILSIKDCLKKGAEKFNINPLNSLRYLLMKEIIPPEAKFNHYKDKYNNQPMTFNDSNSSSCEEEELYSVEGNSNNRYLFLHFLLNQNDKSKDHLEERIFSFLFNYKAENEVITYDHYSAFEMANFIHCNLSLINKNQLASFICSSKQFNLKALFYFIQLFSFTNHHITEALRLLFTKLPIINELQIIHHVIQLFSIKYNRDNFHSIKLPDQTLVISLSAIELSEEISLTHNSTNRTLSDYIEKVKALSKSGAIDLTFLCDVYNKVVTNPLSISYLDKNRNLFEPRTAARDVDKDVSNALIELLKEAQLNSVDNDQSYYGIEIRTDDLVNLLQCSWSNCLGIFSQMLNEYSNEQIIQKCINNILTLARISGELHLYTISDTFINTIINLTSINEGKELQPKNIQALRSLISFVLANGKHISSSWYLILCLVSKIDYYNSESLSLALERRIADALSKHFSQNLIESVYSCTIMFPSKQLNDFMLALCEVVKNEIDSKHNRTFSLHKVIEVANFNLFREQIELETLWKIIYETFISIIIEHENAQIEICTNIIDSLRQIAIKLLNKSESGNKFQLELFKPFERLLNKALVNESSIITEMILECLASIANSSSRIIGSGWIVIFEVIKSAVKNSGENSDKLLLSVLKPFAENVSHYTSKRDIFISYVKCLCYLSLFNDMKEYSSITIAQTLSLAFTKADSLLQNIKWLLYGFDELIKVNPCSYINLLFEFLTNSIDLFFQSSGVWEYCYYSYFKVHLVTIVLFCFVYRLHLWPKEYDDNEFNYGFKEEAKEVHLNVMLYLNKTAIESITIGQYKNDNDLVLNKIDCMKKYNLIQYTTLIESFIEKLFELITVAVASNKSQLNLRLYIEDIIITLLQLSLFNQTPETMFNIISTCLQSSATQISSEGWKRIGVIIYSILKSMSNLSKPKTESQMKDIMAYSYYFASFYKHTLINFFKEIELNENNWELHFICCNKVIASLMVVDQQSNAFKETSESKSQLALGTMKNIAIAKTVILDRSPNALAYYNETIVNTLALLNKAFVEYSLDKEEDHPLIEVIQIEIQSILPKFIKVMNKEDLRRVYTLILDLLLARNKTLRQLAKGIIEIFVDNKAIFFTLAK